MATLIRRPKPKDTIKKFEATAELKYQAGLILIDSGEDHTGVEQFGYAAEMLLKSAYFRIAKQHHGLARSTSEIRSSHLREAAREGQRLGVPYDPESYHSLLFWATLLVETRRDQHRPLRTNRENDLLARIRQMHQLWMIEHRYQPINYPLQDVLQMRANVTWLHEHYKSLGR
jgi:hypothetical protein